MNHVRRDRLLTAGVHRIDGHLVHAGLGLAIPDDCAHRALADDLGLVSTRIRVMAGRRTLLLPPWWHSAARPLPASPGRAVLTSIIHNAAGMAPLLALALGAAVLGAGLGSPALVAVGTVAMVCLCSVLVHEAGHVLAFRLLLPRDAPAILVVRGVSCRLVRPSGGTVRDAVVVCAGAAGPLLIAVLLLPAITLAPLLVSFAAMVALAHAAALLIPVGDGAALRDAAREGRRSQPVVPLEDPVQSAAHSHHEKQGRRVSPREGELRHGVEVHAVDAGDE
jgi:hypothetical protein